MAELVSTANTAWHGGLSDGSGTVSFASGAAGPLPVSWASRTEAADGKTSPEELIAAAHAGCFTMQLSNMLHQEGVEVESVETSAQVGIRNIDGTPTIATSELKTTVTGSDLDEIKVREFAETAKAACIISRALAGIKEITLEVTIA